MASNPPVVIVSHIDITTRYYELSRELQLWENSMNETGGFDLVFGDAPRTVIPFFPF